MKVGAPVAALAVAVLVIPRSVDAQIFREVDFSPAGVVTLGSPFALPDSVYTEFAPGVVRLMPGFGGTLTVFFETDEDDLVTSMVFAYPPGSNREEMVAEYATTLGRPETIEVVDPGPATCWVWRDDTTTFAFSELGSGTLSSILIDGEPEHPSNPCFEISLIVTKGEPHSDTTFVFAQTSRDMTGDGVEERLTLRAQGSAADSLRLTFTIHRGAQELYRHSFLVDRMIGREGDVFASDSDWERRLRFYREFFAESRFSTPRDIVTAHGLDPLRAPEGVDLDDMKWRQFLSADVPVFGYSPGGDRIYSLVWYAPERDFIDMHPCC